MSLFFLSYNLHFALEMAGAVAFLAMAWLGFDALRVRRDFVTASRGIGFLLLAAWQVLHSLEISTLFGGYALYSVQILGVIFILWNMILEKPVARPEFKAVLVLPSLAVVSLWSDLFTALIFLLVAFLSFRQYKVELKKVLLPFWIGFLFLALGRLADMVYGQISAVGGLWISGHAIEALGFIFLACWVWKYLAERIREEMLLIFLSLSFLMAVFVSLTFSVILSEKIADEVKANLSANVRVMDFAIKRQIEEARAKTRLIASDPKLAEAVFTNDFSAMQNILEGKMEGESLGFLGVTDREGEVLLRAHALSQKEDSAREEEAVGRALRGEAYVTLESGLAEKFSIRAASPILRKEKIVGVVFAGFILDSAFADNIKRVTGLDVSILEGDWRVGSTLFAPDGRTRGTDTRQADKKIAEIVLHSGKSLSVQTLIFSRPYLASYVPLQNAEGKIVGMLEAAVPQKDIAEAASSTNRLTLLASVIMMLVLMVPIYFIIKRLEREIHLD